MKDRRRTPDRPDTEGGPESVLPGQRSGEGLDDLFRHIVRDERRKAGLGRRAPLEGGKDAPEPGGKDGGGGNPPKDPATKP